MILGSLDFLSPPPRASYEPFSQSRGVGKIKKNPKLLFYFLSRALKLISRTGG